MVKIVCRLPGIAAPKGVDFKVTDVKGTKRVSGESGNIKYSGSSDRPTKYALAVKGDDGSIKLIPTQVVDLVVSTKKELEEAEKEDDGRLIWEQRNALGEAFGTKKAKSAIVDKSRNRLDADSLEGLEGSIVDRVKTTTSNLPTEQDRTKALDKGRNIPPYDLETRSVKDIYPITKLIPPRELNLINPTDLQNSAGGSRAEHLPYQDSAFVNSRVDTVISEGTNVTSRLQLLSYLSLLMAVYHNRRINDKQKLSEKLGNPPDELVGGIIERFTVPRAGFVGRSHDRSFVFDPANVDKLLSYMFVLVLHIDEFQVDINPLAHELSLRNTKVVSLFRNVGCSIRNPSQQEAQARGLDAKTHKVAKLSAPLVLPDTTKKGGKAR